jgi:hypothetical protein
MSPNPAFKALAAEIEQPTGPTQVALEALEVPAVCFLDDVSRILRVSRRTIEKLRRHGAFPIPEMRSLDKRPRWSGAAVIDFMREQADPFTRRRRTWKARAQQLVSHAAKSGRGPF